MKVSTPFAWLLGGLLLVSGPPQAFAQKQHHKNRKEQPAAGLPWFTVQNKVVVVQTGNQAKPLDKDVTLPNGIRVEAHTQSIVLTNGKRVKLQEGDMLSLNGEYIPKSPTNTAPPADATASLLPGGATGPKTVPVVASTGSSPAPVAKAPVGATPSIRAFTYRAEAPVNGKLKGVVELGASGFNMFIVRIDEKRNWKTEKVEYGNSLVLENMATEDDVRTGLKAYIGKMLDFGVNGRDIHFVVSSGAATVPSTLRIVKGLQALKYVVTTVTPEREGALALRAALPPGFSDKAFVVDMGSANTKISWLVKGQPQVQDTYGSKYFEKNVADAAVAAEVKAKATQVPATLRSTCFVIGGVPYELAKAVRQGDEPFTVLHGPTEYSELKGAKIKSGLNIYQAVAEATGCQQFVFGYDTPFTIGYLLSL